MNVLLYVALGALGVGGATYLPPLVWRHLQVGRMRRLFRGRIALTFDDGPDATLTPALLDLLDRHKARASFYLVGWRAEKQPLICERIVRAGHELGCHSFRHEDAWTVWPWKAVADVRLGYESLSRWIRPNAAYRPPHGHLTTWQAVALIRRGACPVWWTLDSDDARATLPDADAMCARIISQGGGVVLLHIHHKRQDRQEFVLRFVDTLLSQARQHGLEICLLGEVFSPGRGPAERLATAGENQGP